MKTLISMLFFLVVSSRALASCDSMDGATCKQESDSATLLQVQAKTHVNEESQEEYQEQNEEDDEEGKEDGRGGRGGGGGGQGACNSSRVAKEDDAKAEMRGEVEALGGPSVLWERMCRPAELEAGKFPCGFLGCHALDSDADGFVTKSEFVDNFQSYLNEITHVNTDENPKLLDSQLDHGETPQNAPSAAPDNGTLLLASVEQSSATRLLAGSQSDDYYEEKIWVAIQLPKLEGRICKRNYSPVKRCCGPKYFSSGCPWGYNNVGAWCKGCLGESELLGFCWSRCNDLNVPHLTHGCELGVVAYCTDSQSRCVRQAVELSVNWAKMFFSFTPVGMPFMKTVQAVESSAGIAIKPFRGMIQMAIKTAKAIAKRRHAKKMLWKYMMKKNGHQISSEQADDIIDGGFELIAMQTIKNPTAGFLADLKDEVKEKLRKMASEAISMLDPFGVYDAVKAFDVGPNCEDLKIDPFPGTPVLIKSHRGENLQDNNGNLYLTTNAGSWEKWTLVSAGDDKVFIKSHRDKNLQDNKGNLNTLTTEAGFWEKWAMVSAGDDKVFIRSHRGENLQDDNGNLKLTTNAGSWEKWSFVR